ncbi:hypothetical protein RFI_12952 [Reticulomyxa filosa]|uniref:Viral A-type inclusion protein n=1 Tax=Reticulomyxa filosa TaxID=46433 RepID=X6NDZ2_RETFI|nr:hypothetical protein RFI_12952 [Reticulomyxa filosa]|eukprot:ETO24206.1 hypothetical protein RFI_12952 [Reticulomyxa filosa]
METEVKQLNDKIVELKNDNDRQNDELVNDKQRLLYTIKQKDIAIRRHETDAEKQQEKYLQQIEEKNQQIRNLEIDIFTKKGELNSLGDLVDTLQKELEDLKYEVSRTPKGPEITAKSPDESKMVRPTHLKYPSYPEDEEIEDDTDPRQPVYPGHNKEETINAYMPWSQHDDNEIISGEPVLGTMNSYGFGADEVIDMEYGFGNDDEKDNSKQIENTDADITMDKYDNLFYGSKVEPTEPAATVEPDEFNQQNTRNQDRIENTVPTGYATANAEPTKSVPNAADNGNNSNNSNNGFSEAAPNNNNKASLNNEIEANQTVMSRIEEENEQLREELQKKTQELSKHVKTISELEEVIKDWAQGGKYLYSNPNNDNNNSNDEDMLKNDGTNQWVANKRVETQIYLNQMKADLEKLDQFERMNQSKRFEQHELLIPKSNQQNEKQDTDVQSNEKVKTKANEYSSSANATTDQQPSSPLLYGVTPGGVDPVNNTDNKGNENAPRFTQELEKMKTAKETATKKYEQAKELCEKQREKLRDLYNKLEESTRSLEQLRDVKNVKIHRLWNELRDAKKEFTEKIASMTAHMEKQSKEIKRIEQEKINTLVMFAHEMEKMRGFLKK